LGDNKCYGEKCSRIRELRCDGEVESFHLSVYRISCKVGSCKDQQLEGKKENGVYQQSSVAGNKNHASYFKQKGIE
jgi:hypothetical protein